MGDEEIFQAQWNTSSQSLISNSDHNIAIRGSILVVVTGGWALSEYRDDVHILYTRIIIQNYLEICEASFRVKLVMITYASDDEWTWRNFLSMEHTCSRSASDFNLELRTYERRSIPKGSFGTAGDLAIRHREIFRENLHDFDIFVSQEDDVSIRLQNIEYFKMYEERFRDTKYYPGLVFNEIDNGRWFTDFRLRNGNIFNLRGRPVFRSAYGTNPCVYIISRDELQYYAENSSWTDPSSIQGEFNVMAATYAFMDGYKEIVIPLDDWESAMYHHMPNRYIRLLPYVEVGALHPDNYPLTIYQQSRVFESCFLNTSHRSVKHGRSCIDCLLRKQKVSMSTSLIGGSEKADVRFVCK